MMDQNETISLDDLLEFSRELNKFLKEYTNYGHEVRLSSDGRNIISDRYTFLGRDSQGEVVICGNIGIDGYPEWDVSEYIKIEDITEAYNFFGIQPTQLRRL